jgi:hypothetical protein
MSDMVAILQYLNPFQRDELPVRPVTNGEKPLIHIIRDLYNERQILG